MSAVYQILLPLNLKYVRLSGCTHLEEVQNLSLAYLDDPKFDAGLRQLIDLRDLQDAKAAFWEMTRYKKFFTEKYRDLGTVTRIVIVATTPFTKRLSRMFCMVVADKQIMDVTVVGCMADALADLGISAPRFEALATL